MFVCYICFYLQNNINYIYSTVCIYVCMYVHVCVYIYILLLLLLFSSEIWETPIMCQNVYWALKVKTQSALPSQSNVGIDLSTNNFKPVL